MVTEKPFVGRTNSKHRAYVADLRRLALLGWLAAALNLDALGQPLGSDGSTIWTIALGETFQEVDRQAWKRLACGSDGGPPLRPLSSWADFRTCQPDQDGLYEIYVEYETSLEDLGRHSGSHEPLSPMGTSEAYFPIVASALLDERGVVQGIRIVTDPRADQRKEIEPLRLRPRNEHYLLGLYLLDRFGMSLADCVDLPAERGERAVVGQFVKTRCVKAVGNLTYEIEMRFLRKRGQHDIDPTTGQLTEDEFESITRAEVRSISYRIESK
jgi:hypothetical protein